MSDDAPPAGEHAPGSLDVPVDVTFLEGEVTRPRDEVAVVVSRFNGAFTNRLLRSALTELDRAGVSRAQVTVMAVPGAFELPVAAVTLARSQRYACIVALGCVIRGDTAHFEYVAGEAASGLRAAAVETGVPVAFGVLTVDSAEQADRRADRGSEAVRTALEMAEAFRRFREHPAAAAAHHR